MIGILQICSNAGVPQPTAPQPMVTILIEGYDYWRKKEKELTETAVKKMIYKQVVKEGKQFDPTRYNMPYLEDNLIEVEITQSILMIIN